MSQPNIHPRHFADDGRATVPSLMWIACLWVMRGWLVLVFALSSRQQTEQLLVVFYPRPEQLLQGMAPGAIALIVCLLMAFHRRLLDRGWTAWVALCRPLIVLGLLADASLLLWQSSHHHWQFSWGVATGLWFDAMLLVWLLRSERLQWMLSDWRSHKG
ncbi:DUF2919 domain-containing protein [Aestuariibacter halophilus]|uniref:DUF2919 domain-containing protein n=1 Tax=Fluctibacter halophilus TaxID=226011 RepID=A0ABS8G4I6_9ALTE|nr:DUF2919 family protein [Aestuariibacter halophilus]MCC2615470.1 DUF2919 domain-containing protein [Aestuariibacter halophilus]